MGTTMKRLICISVETKEWMEGNNAWFDLQLAPGASVTVYWGDGTHSSCGQYNLGGWCRVERLYNCKGKVRPFQIEIFSEDEKGLVGIIDGTWEMTTNSVIVENAPGLVYMRYHHVNSFDFSGCPNLEELDCQDYKQESIDLSSLSNLRKLSCCYSHLRQLDLTSLPNLQNLDITGNSNLKKVKIGNDSILKSLSIINLELDVHSEKWLRKIVEDNGGEVIDQCDWW